MTTIVYDHNKKQIACDSRESADGFLHNDTAEKFYRRDGVIWFISGHKGDANIFIDSFEHNKEAVENVSCGGMYVKDKLVYVAAVENGIYKTSLMDYTDGCGSGGWMALAAVDLGKSAKEAVEYAITRDLFSGGKIRVFDIETNKFLQD